METTTKLLDQVKVRYGLPSDYALAAKLEVTRAGISSYRTGRSHLGDDAALKVAELLELDAGYVLASMEAERAQTDAARKVWEQAADRLKHYGVAAALAMVVAAPALLPHEAQASEVVKSVYYVK